jgi:hypothetical protein
MDATLATFYLIPKIKQGFFYTIFSVKKNKCWKILKLLENRYLVVLSIHILKLEISGCDTCRGGRKWR